MTQPLDRFFEKIRLKTKKQEDQSRFHFLKSLEGEYDKKDFSILDPFCLQQHPFIQKEQIRWVQKMGVGSYNGRLQLEHIDLQNALEERLQPKGFFTTLSLKDIQSICQECLGPLDLEPLFQTFEQDPLGLLLLGFEQHLKAPLIYTQLAPFSHLYLVEEPLHTLLKEHSPLFLLPPFTLAAMHTALDLIPTFKKERIELLEKTTFLADSLKKLGFDLSLQQFSIHINTSKKEDYQKSLKEEGFLTSTSSHGMSLHLRIDHTENLLSQFIEKFKKISFKNRAIFC